MKMKFLFFLLILSCIYTISFSGYTDGLIDEHEYEYGVIWTNNNQPLIVNGGGADIIEMRNSSYLQIFSTSTPVNDNWNTGGITDILLLNYSHLDYLDGSTEEITVGSSATASLYGGRIDAITSLQKVVAPSIDLYCQPDWEWVETGDVITGITGHWLDGTAFDIELINDNRYDPTWMNINIMPEPTTLALLGLGCLLIRKR